MGKRPGHRHADGGGRGCADGRGHLFGAHAQHLYLTAKMSYHGVAVESESRVQLTLAEEGAAPTGHAADNAGADQPACGNADAGRRKHGATVACRCGCCGLCAWRPGRRRGAVPKINAISQDKKDPNRVFLMREEIDQTGAKVIQYRPTILGGGKDNETDAGSIQKKQAGGSGPVRLMALGLSACGGQAAANRAPAQTRKRARPHRRRSPRRRKSC